MLCQVSMPVISIVSLGITGHFSDIIITSKTHIFSSVKCYYVVVLEMYYHGKCIYNGGVCVRACVCV